MDKEAARAAIQAAWWRKIDTAPTDGTEVWAYAAAQEVRK